MAKRKRPRRPEWADGPRPAPVLELVPHGGALRALTEVVTDAGVPALERLQAARDLPALVELLEGVAWADARAAGYSWGRLGDVAGITRSGAQQRAAALLAKLEHAAVVDSVSLFDDLEE